MPSNDYDPDEEVGDDPVLLTDFVVDPLEAVTTDFDDTNEGIGPDGNPIASVYGVELNRGET